MAVIDEIADYATPLLISTLAASLGTQNSVIERTLNGAVPGLLAALLQAARDPKRMRVIAAVLAVKDPFELADLTELAGQSVKTAAQAGDESLSSVLGDASTTRFAIELRAVSGLPLEAARLITGISGALVTSVLTQISQREGLSEENMLSRLRAESGDIAKALPVEFAECFRAAGFLGALDDQIAAQHRGRAVPPRSGRPLQLPLAVMTAVTRWPWVLGPLAGLTVLALVVWGLGHAI